MPLISHARRVLDVRGQSLTEFALLVPVLLLIVMVGIDFGRVYLGWVNLQSMARVAAGYAASNPDGWSGAGDPDVVASYQERVRADADLTNCLLPDRPGDLNSTPHDKTDVPDPVFTGGFDLGDPVEVQLVCQFGVVTPIVSDVLGGSVEVAASAVFPVTTGAITSVPGGGGSTVQAPIAAFLGSARSGYAPLTVDFADLTDNNPTAWIWDFQDGVSFTQSPSHTFSTPGVYSVTLQVSNTGGFDNESKSDYIEVVAPPTTGPIPEFSAVPRSGSDPLRIDFTDDSTPSGTITAWAWDFDGNGTTDSTVRNPSHTYGTPGIYDVRLRVTSPDGTNTQTKRGFVIVNARVCTVPNFAGAKRNDAQGIWAANGFSTTVNLAPGTGNYKINTQSLPGNLVDPPGGCTGAVITVGP